jgi:hypothetical protein
MDEMSILREFRADIDDCDDLTEDQARAALRARIDAAPRPGRSRRRVRIAAIALALGLGLGFGLATWLAPSGSATTTIAGFGFLPANGWTVVQTGTVGSGGTATAIAANVPIDHATPAAGMPSAVLRGLPATGAAIVARLSPRGDQSIDSRFPLRSLPLRVEDGDPARLPSDLASTSLVAVAIRGGVNGYNVDAKAYFGQPPSPTAVARVDRQLERLVVGASGVTLVVQPTIVRSMSQRMLIYGSVSSGRTGQKVTVQFKACGSSSPGFRDVLETTTRAGGGFSFAELQPFTMGVSGVFRAVSGDEVSGEVPIQQQAGVFLAYPRNGRFRAGVQAVVPFWRRYVLLQRLDRARGTWITMRRLVLTDQQVSPSGPGLPSIPASRTFFTDWFRPAVKRGTTIRVAFPLSQARPCYLPGVSEVRRT